MILRSITEKFAGKRHWQSPENALREPGFLDFRVAGHWVAGHGTWAPPKIVGFGSAGDDPTPPTSNRNPEGSDFSPAPSGLPTRIHRIRSSLPLPSLISLSTSLNLSL